MRSTLRVHWFLLIFLVGLLLRAIPLGEKQFFKGDEVRSYLAATGHEGEYRILLSENQHPLGAWATADDWKRLIRPEAAIGLWAVAQDLAYWDIHPPLYFWLLRQWSLLFGVNFWSGALLNIALEMAILLLLVHIGWMLWRDRTTAQWAGAIWWLDPTAVRVSPLMRSYILLTLVGLLFVYALYRLFYHSGQSRRLGLYSLGLIVTMLLGLLTHYLFLFFTATALVLMGWLVGVNHLRSVAKLLGLVLVAFTLFIFIYPDFFWAFTFLQEPRPEFWPLMPERLARTLAVNGALYLPLLLCGVLLIGERLRDDKVQTLSLVAVHVKRLWQSVRRRGNFFLCLALFAILPVLATDLFFILLISPHHAMGAHYVTFATPLLALLTTALLTLSHRRKTLATALLIILIVLNFVQLHPAIRNFGVPPRLTTTDLATPGVLLFDNPSSVHWFNVLLHLPDEQAVFVASQSTLLSEPAQWLPRLQKSGGLYIALIAATHDPTAATPEGREQILRLIPRQTTVTLEKTLTPLGLSEMRIYRISPKPLNPP
jgi:Dolichyl-phosphate-mannose-protein mannosyltransferase